MTYHLRHAIIIAIFIIGTYTIAKPFFADYHYRRALNIEATEQTEAIASFRKAINLDPSNAEYHGKLGQLYLSRSRRLPSLTIDSQLTTANNQQQTANSQRTSLNLAAASYQKAIDLCPQNGNYWLGLAMVYEQMAKSTSASNLSPPTYTLHSAACYKTAISLDPNNAFYRTMLGLFHLRNGNEEEGLDQYEKAITCLPKTHLYDFLKGKDVKEEFLNAALRGLKKAIALYPKDADIRSQLGGIYRKKGMYDEAIEQYEHALKLKPEHKGFKRNINSLKSQIGSH